MARKRGAAAKQSADSTNATAPRASKKSKGSNKAAALQAALGKQDHESVSWGAMRQLHDEQGGSIEEVPEGQQPVGDLHQ